MVKISFHIKKLSVFSQIISISKDFFAYNGYSYKYKINLIRKILKIYNNMTIYIVHILNYVVKISSHVPQLAQFLHFLDIFAYNSKMVIATNP